MSERRTWTAPRDGGYHPDGDGPTHGSPEGPGAAYNPPPAHVLARGGPKDGKTRCRCGWSSTHTPTPALDGDEQFSAHVVAEALADGNDTEVTGQRVGHERSARFSLNLTTTHTCPRCRDVHLPRANGDEGQEGGESARVWAVRRVAPGVESWVEKAMPGFKLGLEPEDAD